MTSCASSVLCAERRSLTLGSCSPALFWAVGVSLASPFRVKSCLGSRPTALLLRLDQRILTDQRGWSVSCQQRSLTSITLFLQSHTVINSSVVISRELFHLDLQKLGLASVAGSLFMNDLNHPSYRMAPQPFSSPAWTQRFICPPPASLTCKMNEIRSRRS